MKVATPHMMQKWLYANDYDGTKLTNLSGAQICAMNSEDLLALTDEGEDIYSHLHHLHVGEIHSCPTYPLHTDLAIFPSTTCVQLCSLHVTTPCYTFHCTTV